MTPWGGGHDGGVGATGERQAIQLSSGNYLIGEMPPLVSVALPFWCRFHIAPSTP